MAHPRDRCQVLALAGLSGPEPLLSALWIPGPLARPNPAGHCIQAAAPVHRAPRTAPRGVGAGRPKQLVCLTCSAKYHFSHVQALSLSPEAKLMIRGAKASYKNGKPVIKFKFSQYLYFHNLTLCI